jgi:hypothetical protein|uniref:Uncharacterized protein n=1 Tax=Podoviridae sp. ctiuS14 TaxID=2827620 RepID=A0A8S5LMS3_9CAUD|nr:MAG TPA: hypothetical protein [Podoviridae sp. ctiuS14]
MTLEQVALKANSIYKESMGRETVKEALAMIFIKSFNELLEAHTILEDIKYDRNLQQVVESRADEQDLKAMKELEKIVLAKGIDGKKVRYLINVAMSAKLAEQRITRGFCTLFMHALWALENIDLTKVSLKAKEIEQELLELTMKKAFERVYIASAELMKNSDENSLAYFYALYKVLSQYLISGLDINIDLDKQIDKFFNDYDEAYRKEFNGIK